MQQGPAPGAKFMSQRGKPMQERRVGGWQAVQAVQGTPHGQGYPQQHHEEPSGRPIPSLVGGPSKVRLPPHLQSTLKCFQFRIHTFPLPMSLFFTPRLQSFSPQYYVCKHHIVCSTAAFPFWITSKMVVYGFPHIFGRGVL